MKKIAFVIPWYGENISGGAEAELRGIVHHLSDKGVELEILTTCVKDFTSDWNVNYYDKGEADEAGIKVIRFPVRKRNTRKFDKVNLKFMTGETVSKKEEGTFLKEMVNSPKLYDYISKNKNDYALFVFIPYMFGTTYYGLQAARGKSVMIPCLHDEAYAYMETLRDEFSLVSGMIFNAKPEEELAHRLINMEHVKTITPGIGMDTDISFDPNRFREKFKIEEPFILYAGRKDAGKNVDALLNYFAAWKKDADTNTKLVLIGGGSISIPEAVKSDVIDLGFVDVQDKYDACAAAAFLCQPSKNESFSLVIMESWLCKRPVLVNAECAVTKNFADESKGGRYFKDYAEFKECTEKLLADYKQAEQMGLNGREYVLNNFSWPVVVEKYVSFFESLAK